MSEEAKQARRFVKQKLYLLEQSSNESATRAILAKLRHGIGKRPGSQPELWDITLNDLPEALLSKGLEPTRGEWAIHTALTLYALHQQGKDPKKQSVNSDGISLGTAARNLILSDANNEDAVNRRFNVTVMMDNFGGFCWQLRGIIQLLKAKNIAMDYPMLTEDLYWFQFPERQDSIRLKWGQDFYRTVKKEENSSEVK